MSTQIELKKVRTSVMNTVHDLAVLVARDEGLFEAEGLDVEVVTTPGRSKLAQTTKHCATVSLIAPWRLYTTQGA